MTDKELLMNTVILDYDNKLKLYINTDDISWFVNKAFFKMRLKHKVEKIEDNVLIFKSELTYLDFIEIDELLKKKLSECEYIYYSTQRLKQFVNDKDIYIEKRASLGLELKSNTNRFDEEYHQFKSVIEAGMERKLRDKQMKDAFFMFLMMKSANFSVPGSGKTSSALAMYCYLKTKGLVDRVLMIGPKSAFGSWIDEFKACFGDKEELVCFSVVDKKIPRKNLKSHLKYNTANCNLLLFNYEIVNSFLDEICNIVANRTLLVFDEVHKVKSLKGERAKAALAVAKNANYTIAMTGTPIPNTYADLYNMLHILFDDEYNNFFGYTPQFLKNPSEAEIEQINNSIQPFFCRTTKKELQVPDANDDIICNVEVTQEEQRLFDILSNKYHKNKLVLFIRILQMESNASLILQKLDIGEFAEVLDYTDDIEDMEFVDYSNDVKALIDEIGVSSKKKACVDLAKKLVNEGKKTIIWCIFKDSIRSITKLLEDEGIKTRYIMGEVDIDERLQLINDFRNGLFDVLIANPHTLAESVSFHSVCHDAIYFEYDFNLVHQLQSKDRIHRLGLSSNQYTQYYYIQIIYENENGERYSMDNKIYTRLKEKEQVMLEAIDNNKFEPIYTDEEDLDIIFRQLYLR